MRWRGSMAETLVRLRQSMPSSQPTHQASAFMRLLGQATENSSSQSTSFVYFLTLDLVERLCGWTNGCAVTVVGEKPSMYARWVEVNVDEFLSFHWFVDVHVCDQDPTFLYVLE
ncbi:craniofacial development protein 2-like [Plakobranchus ocellatus]|uniref:Craniofacial development protein 2-like n=1 Tax=Plakobranchus ocellatus TaxID=259542 RepID=A0AAV3ZEL6_9GAST|nr:craniofacial development protein 2-like [Plakobranchus ocellatus]